MAEERRSPRGRAHELSRRRRTRAVLEETGRQHHMGGPPPVAPVHTDAGVEWTEATDVRLRQLTDQQLVDLDADLRRRMGVASEALDFEQAATLRDRVAAVTAERTRRER